MLSILIGHSFFQRFDRKQFERAKPYPPLATLQAAALLRQAGHELTLFDATLAESTREYARQLAAVKPQLVLFYEDNYNYLSKMCLGKMRRAACEMIASAHRAGARVIAAGSDVSDAPEPYLRAGADVVLIGEGLATLLQLLPRMESDPSARASELIAGLSGAAALLDGKVTTVEGARVLPTPELDEVPLWDLVDVERYRAVWLKKHGFFSMNMAASRGCSFRCAWCAKPIWGNRYLQRSATAVAAEMTHLKRTFGPDHIWFADDIFGFRVDWIAAFANAVHTMSGTLPFTIQTRADLIGAPMARALREAGCTEAWLGAESGSQRILDAMNKGTTVEEILTARARLKAQEIRVGFFIQIGYLHEDLADLIATRELIDRARPDDIGVSVSYPLPGTKFYDKVKAQLRDKTRWDESDDLAMMFQGTYRSEFYREIRNLLHEQVTVEKLNSAATLDGYRAARSALERRWSLLLAREMEYRTAPLISTAIA
jgi:anaerobic magnesium-protoporphyrin IX monomethyl ester cyclase